MAKPPPKAPSGQRGGFLSLFGGGVSKKRWEAANLADSKGISQNNAYAYGASGTTTIATIATLLGGNGRVRTRTQIYQTWIDMSRDAICSSALQLLSTTAMGGH